MALFEQKQDHVPMQTVLNNVKQMAHNHQARQIAKGQSLAINTVSYEDCARNKNSVWGPCISDMTLQVQKQRMPVIREPNFTDTTWDVEMDKIPLVVGNHDSNPGAELSTVSLRHYLENLNDYMTAPPADGAKLNLTATHDMLAKQKDTHVIMSAQACFLPIEKGKETKFSVALFNYQSRKQDPAVLVIVSTSKGTSAQIVEGQEQELLFNNYGRKADFIGQRLTDNRIERKVSIHGAMTKQEKQDNCIVVIQVPLKQKPKEVHVFNSGSSWGGGGPFMVSNSSGGNNWPNKWGGGASPLQAQPYNSFSNSYQQQSAQFVPQSYECASFGSSAVNFQSSASASQYSSTPAMLSNVVPKSARSFGMKKAKAKAKAEVEAAIVKIAPKTVPTCICGRALEKVSLEMCYRTTSGASGGGVSCDGCGKSITQTSSAETEGGSAAMVWHCPLEKTTYKHRNGYDLCLACGDKQLKFDELNGLKKIERDTRYPIRVTLQYYKSTANGLLDADIMAAIAKLLSTSRKQADFVGSLVTTKDSQRPTEPDLVTQNEVKVVHHPFDPFAPLVVDKYVKIAGAMKANNIDVAYLANFKKEEVTDEDLVNLCRQDLLELIPKMGPRNRFLKWLQSEYPKETTETNFMAGFL